MARKKKADNLEEDAPDLDISSLIDVCFLLLIYFIVTTTIQPKERDLNMQLPAAAPSETPPVVAPMFIRVDKSGQIYINPGASQELVEQETDNRELSELRNRLKDYVATAKAGAQEPIVQIYADGEAQQQRIVDVLNCLAGAKISKVTFTDLVDNL